MTKAKRIFTSYCHRPDEKFRLELDKHLAPLLLQGRVSSWNDRHIRAGAPLYEAIDDNIRVADIILMLISADYLSSKSCQDEMAIALERSKAKQSLAIPIIVRACDWTGLPIGQLLAANPDGAPINSAGDSDVAWYDVIKAIKLILNDWEVENAQEMEEDQAQAPDVSDAVADERAIQHEGDGKRSEQWVFRKESNDIEWDGLLTNLEATLGSLAARDSESGITIQTKQWGEKIIVDVRLPKYRNPKRVLLADIGGYTGYPGYQIEVYPRDGSLKLPYQRARWMIKASGDRVLKQLEPQVGAEFSPADYADYLWEAIKSLA